MAPGTAISRAHKSGTSFQPSRRAACAGKSASRSGVAVKRALTTRSGLIRLTRTSSVRSRAVAVTMLSASFLGTVIAPLTAAIEQPETFASDICFLQRRRRKKTHLRNREVGPCDGRS